MSLINYEHVGRVKTTNSSSSNHHIRSPSSARTRNKQRKWRVLVAIGLLLPTLAAIIGIVAWTISIEVANTSQSPQISALTSSSSSGQSINYRKLHHHHHNQQQQEASHQHASASASKAAAYHQLRRHNSATAAQANEIIGRDDDQSSNEVKSSSSSPLSPAAAASEQQQSTLSAGWVKSASGGSVAPEGAGEPEPASEADAETRASRPVAIAGSGSAGRAQVTRRRVPLQVSGGAMAAASSNLPAPEKTKSESIGNPTPTTKDRRRSSTLLLTNLGQVEALNKSTRDQRQVLETSAAVIDEDKDDQDKDKGSSISSGDGEATVGGSDESRSKDEQDEAKTAPEVVPETSNEAPDKSTKPQEVQVDQLEQQERETKQARDDDEEENRSVRNKRKKVGLAENVKNSSRKFPNGSSKSRKSLQKGATNTNKNPSSEVEKALERTDGGESIEVEEEEEDPDEEDENQTAAAKQNIRLIKATVAKILMAKGLEEPGNSRYTIVNSSSSSGGNGDEDGEGGSGSSDRSELDRSDTPKDQEDQRDQKKGFMGRDERGDEAEVGPRVASKGSESLKPSAALFERPVEDDDRNRYIPQSQSEPKQKDDQQQQQQRDDELSFEAIASAISTTLSANAQQTDDQTRGEMAPLVPATRTRMEDSSGSQPADSSADPEELTGDDDGGSSSVLSANDGRESVRQSSAARRRSPGQHVAEVIDHIVERRKQSSGVAIGGPQIVVVAPVGGSEMKARSLTRELDQSVVAAPGSKASIKVKPMSEDKQQQQQQQRVVSSKKESISTTDKKPRLRTTKPLAARLLGVGGGQLGASGGSLNGMGAKGSVGSGYSERVEVIEDDDSSPFLYKNLDDNFGQLETLDSSNNNNNNDDSVENNSRRRNDDEVSQQQLMGQKLPQEIDFGQDKSLVTLEQLLEDQPASIHVSNQPSQPRLRAPRNGSPIGLAFERYASSMANNSPKPAPSLPAQLVSAPQSATSSQVAGSTGPRIYSAEKLIMEHMLKSKIQLQQAAQAEAARADPIEDPIKRSGNGGHMQQQQHHQQQPKKPQQTQQQHWQPQQQQQQKPTAASNQANKQVKVAPTTVRPHNLSTSTSSTSDVAQEVVVGDKMVKEQRARDSRQQQPRTAGNDQLQATATSSNLQAIQEGPIFMAPNQQHQHNQNHRNQMQHQQSPQQSYLQNPASPEVLQQSSSEDQQQQQFEAANRPQALPTFADQEFNVPAHMAESVIQNIRMSPVSFNMVNGRPTLVGGMAQQVPPYYQPQQQQLQQYPINSQSQSIYHHQQQQQQQYSSNAMASSEMRPIYQSWQPFPIVSAAVNNRLQQQQHQYPLNLQRQSLSDRSTKTITKGLAVHPIAQMALRHLLGSFSRQQKQSRQETPAAAAAASAGMVGGASDSGEILSSSMAPASQLVSARSNIMESGQKLPQTRDTSSSSSSSSSSSALQSADSMMPAGSAQSSVYQQQAINSVNARDSMVQSAAAGSPGLPSMQREATVQDQDMEESYGQVPTYHMAPRAPHYGGGGGQHYPVDEHDKKSKGITFHFGGGPIGGGTQLITSPMGIFKHLMIPLMPNPRVNLNGKVVFGVVLEKSTAIGDAPKKKYKFWGR